MPADISILIITYNRPEDTLALLENLNAQIELEQYVGEILLLNNHSDISYEMVTGYLEQHPELRVKYIDHSENLGVARGRNYLIHRALFSQLLIIDDDMIFPETDALKKLSQYFNKPVFRENNTALISFDVYYFATGERQKNALPHKKYKLYKDKSSFFTYYFSGGAHIVRKDVFEKTGYYPEDFFYGMEEYDLSYRIIDEGYTIGYDNEVRILHKESPKGRATNNKKLAMMWYNKCVVTWRYLPGRYFYSTAAMWAMEYLHKTNFDLFGMLKQLKQIRKIPSRITAQKISRASLAYLKSVKARLWY